MSVLFTWCGLFDHQVSSAPLVSTSQVADQLSRHPDRIECLSPLFEVASSLGPMPFELKIDIYVTRPSTSTALEHLDDKQASPKEKADGTQDPESMASVPILTRQSSNSDQTSNSDKLQDALSPSQRPSSLYTTHSGRPDVPAIVRAFGKAATGESVAVAGMFSSAS